MAENYGYVSGGDWLGAITNLPFQFIAWDQSLNNQEYQREQDRLNRQMQYDFAQNSIKWRVDDARRSGIHPLAALGVSPSSASPVYSSSEAPRAPQFDFGELFRAQVDLAESEAEKNRAEAQSIKGQIQSDGLSFMDSSSPGPTFSQKKTSTEIGSTFVKNEKDRADILKEAAQDSKITTAAYDAKSKLERGDVDINKELDYIASGLSGFSHFANKGETWAKNGARNVKESLIRGFKSFKNFILNDVEAGKYRYNRRSLSPEVLKKIDKIDEELNRWTFGR